MFSFLFKPKLNAPVCFTQVTSSQSVQCMWNKVADRCISLLWDPDVVDTPLHWPFDHEIKSFLVLEYLYWFCTEAGVANPNPRKRKKQPLKIGHGGTLDSNASGVLGKCFSSMWNIIQTILCKAEEYKRYFVFAVVGIGEGTKMLTTMLSGSKVRVSQVMTLSSFICLLIWCCIMSSFCRNTQLLQS